jgi:uridylate kinase
MAKNRVTGVFDKDPNKFADAVPFPQLSYLDFLNRGLGVIDSTAVSLCMENGMDIWVFSLGESGNLERIVRGEHVGTRIGGVP